jgi:hypothetical protein
MRHGDYAWAALAVGVIAYEVKAPSGELMSQAVDRYRNRHPYITNAAVCYIALHLLRAIPQSIDPLHQLARNR